jgi:hypothetical protein
VCRALEAERVLLAALVILLAVASVVPAAWIGAACGASIGWLGVRALIWMEDLSFEVWLLVAVSSMGVFWFVLT